MVVEEAKLSLFVGASGLWAGICLGVGHAPVKRRGRLYARKKNEAKILKQSKNALIGVAVYFLELRT